MHILITGGEGYLAGVLASYFSEQGHRITILSRSKNKLFLNQDNSITWVGFDINGSIEEFSSLDQVDSIVHTVGLNAKDSIMQPEMGLELSRKYINFLIEKCIATKKIKKFIYISSAHVYSDRLCGFIDENTETKNIHPYAISRLMGERMVLRATSNDQINGVVIRLSNVFGLPKNGSQNSWNLLVNQLCKGVIQSKKIQLTGDGGDQRDFISTQNLCKAIDLILNKNDWSGHSRVLNVGSGRTYKTLEIAKIIQSRYQVKFGKEIQIFRNHKKNHEHIDSLIFNIDRLKEIGFTPSSDIEQEIDKLLEYLRNEP